MTVSVLASINDLTITLGNFWSPLNLYDYIAYKLKPYLNLRVFNYYDFDKFLLPIDGRSMPACLKQEIYNLFKQQMSTIEIMKAELKFINSLEEQVLSYWNYSLGNLQKSLLFTTWLMGVLILICLL